VSWVLVTGGAKGIGAAICLALAEQGHNIVIHYRKSQKSAQEVADRCREIGVHAEIIEGDFSSDLALKDFIDRYLQQFDSTSGLVNNAGEYLIAPSLETEASSWRSLFEVNFFAPVFLTQTLASSLEVVVNLGQVGLERGYKTIAAYGASKAALLSVTRSLSRELAPRGVRVNMVSPGYVETTAGEIQVERLPMERMATPCEIASAVAFFFRKESSYITGQNLEVAGGL